MKKIWDWLVISSADPEKTALTVKGFLNTAAGLVLVFSPLVHLAVTKEQLDGATEFIVQGVLVIYTVASGIATLLGLARKIVLTFTNK